MRLAAKAQFVRAPGSESEEEAHKVIAAPVDPSAITQGINGAPR
jgi:hypothetical protein